MIFLGLACQSKIRRFQGMNVFPVSIDSKVVLQSHPPLVVRKYAQSNERLSKRNFNEKRKVEMHKIVEPLKNCVLAKAGNSVVLIWIRLEIAENRLDVEEGYFIPYCKLPRTKNRTNFDRIEKALTYAELINAHIREWNVIDLSKLIISEQHSWCIYADISILNDDGNIYSLIWKALIEALLQTKTPILEEMEVVSLGYPVSVNPVELEFAVEINEKILEDPDKLEEGACDNSVIKCYRDGRMLWYSGSLPK
eukprot:NODE_43_length_33755_cov_1.178542.p19 type:complete len:252 gc:universal NODE_43_length_33755_cov_1.178542:24094-23339(-)